MEVAIGRGPARYARLPGMPGAVPAEELYRGLDNRIETLARKFRQLEGALDKAGVVHWQPEGFRPGPAPKRSYEDAAEGEPEAPG